MTRPANKPTEKVQLSTVLRLHWTKTREVRTAMVENIRNRTVDAKLAETACQKMVGKYGLRERFMEAYQQCTEARHDVYVLQLRLVEVDRILSGRLW
jgi:hypothetical protein